MAQRFASTAVAKARNKHDTATQYQDETKYTDLDIATPDGVQIRICRVPITKDVTQFSVFINTEEFDEAEIDGNPPIQVVLNDATLHDQEPA